MLALHDKNEIISIHQESSLWISLPNNGGVLSVAENGWTNGTYYLDTVRSGQSVPEGKQIVNREVILEDELPKWYYTFADIPPEPIPDRVSSRQFKMQLEISGLTSAVESWINSQSKLIQIAYYESSTFVKDDSMMESGFTALGFTSEQIDNFFLAASLL